MSKSAPPSGDDLKALRSQLRRAMHVDRHRLQRKLDRLVARPDARDLASLREAINQSVSRAEQRQAIDLQLAVPAELPIAAHAESIVSALRDSQAIIVCGATGSGKSTQLPKLALTAGRGVRGTIGMTQPRRIAARSVAARVAEEVKSEIGAGVGYKVRFGDRTGPNTRVKVMTDGILLAETQRDRWLNEYDTLILDEAHERNLNTDLLLGYLQGLLQRRRDLKLVVASATLDADRFSEFLGGAPVFDVEGRGYPVEMQYQPRENEEEDLAVGIARALRSLPAEGDVLVFLPTERDIRECAEVLRGSLGSGTDILPLFGRMDAGAQARIFKPHKKRHVVLATNVAETSLTVPGVRYVVDSGLARVSRYSVRSKIQRLPVEPISQASAAQRAGRCGRVAPGTCVRLYSEEDLAERPCYTEPEIQRTNLAAVVLKLKAMGFGDIREFPFLDAPQSKLVNDGYRLLHELGALDADDRLSGIGRRLASWPVDPRLGRMLVAAEDYGVVPETIVITAALAAGDPRERPIDRQAEADSAHANYGDPRSDFLFYLNLWRASFGAVEGCPNKRLRALCNESLLSFTKMRDWRDTADQLAELMNDEPAAKDVEYAPLHKAILTGLMPQIAVRDERGRYRGVRGTQLRLFPGSFLKSRPPRWVMAAELTETGNHYLRSVARIEPDWVVEVAEGLLSSEWFEPHWSADRGRAGAYERRTCYGLTVIARRRVDLARFDPGAAREVLLSEAIMAGTLDGSDARLAANRAVIDGVQALERRARRHDLYIGDGGVLEWYRQRLPETINDARTLRRWLRSPDGKDLELRREDILTDAFATLDESDYPPVLDLGAVAGPLGYQYTPGEPGDGITVEIPLLALNQVDAARLDWLIPGWLAERVEALLRQLPKSQRKALVPVPDFARGFGAEATFAEGELVTRLAAHIEHRTGLEIDAAAFDLDSLPPWMRARVRVVEGETLVAEGRDFRAIRRSLLPQVGARIGAAADWGIARTGVTAWDFGDLPVSVRTRSGEVTVKGFPCLVDRGDSVDIEVAETAAQALARSRAGVRRLMLLASGRELKYLKRGVPDETTLLRARALYTRGQLRNELIEAAADTCFRLADTLPTTQAEFGDRLSTGRARLVAEVTELHTLLVEVFKRHQVVRERLSDESRHLPPRCSEDLVKQLDGLVFRGFVSATPTARLPHLPRYLEAAERRIAAALVKPGRDGDRQAQLDLVASQVARLPADRAGLRAELRWCLEEFRVSLFAQELGTAEPVSKERLLRRIRDAQVAA